MEVKKILVLCTGNSCRSQMAEGYLRHFAKGRTEVYSAGLEAHGVNPKAIEAMEEEGIDISGHTSNYVHEYDHIDFDFVITVCDNTNEHCPVFPGKAQRIHHNFPDPSKVEAAPDEITRQFRQTRDLIRDFCLQFSQRNL